MAFEGRSVFILPLKIYDHPDRSDHFWSKINLIYDHLDLQALLIKDQPNYRAPFSFRPPFDVQSSKFFLINQNFFSSKLYIFWGYTFLLHTAKRALKFWHNFRPGSRCDSELAHRRWKENDQEIYKESSKKNSTIDERLRRLHRESIFDVTAFHFLLLTHQNIIYIPVIS